MAQKLSFSRRLATAVRWPVGVGLTSWRYMWRTTPMRRVEEPVDPERPTILFTGESVMFGEGLTWDESIPAQVGAMMGVQTANLAVDGYSTDQAYMRLARELPRFERPVAVVTIFITSLFGRNLDDDRPHLAPGLVWLAPQPHTRLRSLVQLVANLIAVALHGHPLLRESDLELFLVDLVALANAGNGGPSCSSPAEGPDRVRVARTTRPDLLSASAKARSSSRVVAPKKLMSNTMRLAPAAVSRSASWP